jgi:SAM-dependent methyltransferase
MSSSSTLRVFTAADGRDDLEASGDILVAERSRILDVYARRTTNDYSFADLWSLQIAQRREFLLAGMLRGAGITSLADRNILDVGCGDGRLLRQFNQWGAPPERLHGCDINAERIATAQRLQPAADYQLVDGGELPYVAGSFDLVCQYTVFSSILEPAMRTSLAAEMRRVLRSRGVIAWFDFRYNNPGNAAVRGVTKREIRDLFPDCEITFASLGLLPPLARRITPLSPSLAGLLERVPPLRYAYLALIQPEGASR